VITVVLGGTRSGKSEIAERLAATLPAPITYVATASVGDDDDLQARVAQHRARRPADWRTIEAGAELPTVLAGLHGTAIVDSVGTWIAGVPEFAVDIDALCDACRTREGDTVVVAEEVGLAVHPPTDVGRRFADVIGDCNRRLATIADRVLLVVAGRCIELEPFESFESFESFDT
jgi:adenosylcobinamide kinase/adenosylcobinamide-phosphate guanylyltransferase